jgi:hypothetical protein
MEGYHLPDLQMNPIDLLPKGVEIRPLKSASPYSYSDSMREAPAIFLLAL